MKKNEFPLAIALDLGISPSVNGIGGPWMSSQGTVGKEWLQAVGEVLGVEYKGEKVRTMRALVEAVGEDWDERTMSSTESRSRGGGNITTAGFEALRRGIQRKLSGRELLRPTVQPRLELTPVLGPEEDEVQQRAIRIRLGQPMFRAALLVAYRSRCAISGCQVPEVLEAAHVLEYSLGGSYATSNGILLRADLHALFDRNLLIIDSSRRVRMHPALSASEYGSFDGRVIRDPSRRSDRVPTRAFAVRSRGSWRP